VVWVDKFIATGSDQAVKLWFVGFFFELEEDMIIMLLLLFVVG
jgi:hypothetical protein